LRREQRYLVAQLLAPVGYDLTSDRTHTLMISPVVSW
jgi:hypothetical protein